MNKFSKYANRKLHLNVRGEELDIEFKVKDRLELTTIHETKERTEQYNKLITFCTNIIQRSYPDETADTIENFLATNLESFIEELMIESNLATREMFAKPKGDFRSEENNQGGVSSSSASLKKQ